MVSTKKTKKIYKMTYAPLQLGRFFQTEYDILHIFSRKTCDVINTLQYLCRCWKPDAIAQEKKFYRFQQKEICQVANISISHFKKIISLLKSHGILNVQKLSSNKSDQTNFYALDHAVLRELMSRGEFIHFQKELSMNDQKTLSNPQFCSEAHEELLVKTEREVSDLASSISIQPGNSVVGITLSEALIVSLDNIKLPDGFAVTQLQPTYPNIDAQNCSEQEPVADQTNDKEKDINGSVNREPVNGEQKPTEPEKPHGRFMVVNRVPQAIALADRCISDDPIFEKIRDGLREYKDAHLIKAPEMTLDEMCEKLVTFWNETIGAEKPKSIAPRHSVLMHEALKCYFNGHKHDGSKRTLNDAKAYVMRIARSPNLMGSKFELLLGRCVQDTFLQKVENKTITMAPPLASDLPPEATKLVWVGYHEAEMILRFYVALSLGNSVYKAWFDGLKFSGGKVSAYSNGFQKMYVEARYMGTIIKVQDLYHILKLRY